MRHDRYTGGTAPRPGAVIAIRNQPETPVLTLLNTPLSFPHGGSMKNRFMLAPMTNQQSHDDGILSDDEFTWLTRRAEGGFGMTVTCAAHVQENGKTWPGELGVFGDQHIEGLSRLAAGLRAHGSLGVVQLFHGGRRAVPELFGGAAPKAPSEDAETGAVALTLAEIEALRDSFITAAARCHKAGFGGVEIHAAHGFMICQFLSPEFNRRTDAYGGTPENRARLLDEIIDGIRAACGAEFTIGIRLSPEHNGLVFDEMLNLAARLLIDPRIDFIDMSMRDAFKLPNDAAYADKTLTQWYTGLPRGGVRLGITGMLRTPEAIHRAMDSGADFVVIGRAAILHHDFPQQMADDPQFVPRTTPVAADVLLSESLSPTFVAYMRSFPDFVQPD